MEIEEDTNEEVPEYNQFAFEDVYYFLLSCKLPQITPNWIEDEDNESFDVTDQSILEYAGKTEKQRSLPSEGIHDILTATTNDYYKVLCKRDISVLFPAFPQICNDFSTRHREIDLDSLRQSPVCTTWDAAMIETWWIPDWLSQSEKTIHFGQKIPFSTFISQWCQYLSYLTPGEELGSTSSIINTTNRDIQEALISIFVAIDSIDFSDLFQNDMLYQGNLLRLNVYQFTNNKETQV